jgi:hypothetical protein
LSYDINDVKWNINTQEKTITLDDNITLKITSKDYIGQIIPEYIKKTPFLLGLLHLIFSLLFWLAIIFLLGFACESEHADKSYVPYIAVTGIGMIFFFLTIFFHNKIDKYNERLKKEFHASDKYKQEYFEKILKPNILYNYLKKRIPIHTEIKDNHQLIDSNNFASSNMDKLMSKVYIEAFLLDATGIIINQNNISNEVSGYITGHTSGHVGTRLGGGVSGSINGYTRGKTHTETTHHCHVSFVK